MPSPTTRRDSVPDFTERMRRMPDMLAAHALPISDLAVFLDLPLSTLDQLRAQGKGPRCFKIGRRLYVRSADLRDWLDQMAQEFAA